jgi:exonuclease III
MSLKLISLNIEGHTHLDRLIPFIQAEKPDIFCAQEVFEVDLPFFAEQFGLKVVGFEPMANLNEVNTHNAHALGIWGVAQFSNLEVKQTSAHTYFYAREDRGLPDFMGEVNPNSMNRVVLMSTFVAEGKEYTVGTTHFTWSTKGQTTPEQIRDYQSLQTHLDTFSELVICGDFNAPRGNPLFGMVASRYHDNIPAEYQTSIDGQYHKAGHLQLMVDGLFSTPQYLIENVRLQDGVSDHQAIVSHLSKSTL